MCSEPPHSSCPPGLRSWPHMPQMFQQGFCQKYHFASQVAFEAWDRKGKLLELNTACWFSPSLLFLPFAWFMTLCVYVRKREGYTHTQELCFWCAFKKSSEEKYYLESSCLSFHFWRLLRETRIKPGQAYEAAQSIFILPNLPQLKLSLKAESESACSDAPRGFW